MIPAPERGFDAPPIWELAFSASTTSPAVDAYDVKSVHDLFRDDLPLVERQAPVLHLPVAGFVGGPAPITEIDAGMTPRWWFISASGNELFQAQENFVASNWRRQNAVPGTVFDYPGYDILAERAKARFLRLRDHYVGQGIPFPAPAACELLYNNLIPLTDRSGQKMPLSDVLAEYNRAEKRPILGYQTQWLEEIDGLDKARATLNVTIQVVAVALEDEPPRPVVKFQFIAGAARTDWEEVFTFYDVAHAHIRGRLMRLTTERAHATWLPR